MVLRKLKDVIRKKQLENEDSTSRRLGFATVEEFLDFKRKAKMDARAKANKANQAKLKKKIHDREFEKRTTSSTDQMIRLGGKVKTGMEKFDKIRDEIDKSLETSFRMPEMDSKSNRNISQKKKSKSKSSKSRTRNNKQSDGYWEF